MSREIMDWPDWKLAYALDVYGFDLDEIPKIIKRIKDGESIRYFIRRRHGKRRLENNSKPCKSGE